MKNAKFVSGILAIVGIFMISIALVLQHDQITFDHKIISSVQEFDIKNMAASAHTILKKNSTTDDSVSTDSSLPLMAVSMETAPASVIIPPRIEVFEGMTLEELTIKLDRNLGTGYIAGKGQLIATECIQKGIDPYLAVAIILHETGCRSNCSSLARTCNNVGGQKGSPSCNGTSYKTYATLDEGIVGFVDNLYTNYYSKGLNTVDAIAPRYAQSSTWSNKIHQYIEQIRAN